MENTKTKILSEYRLLRLIIASMYMQDVSLVINREELEQKLYNYYKDERYKVLFQDVITKKYTDDYYAVDLSDGFNKALAWGFLIMIHDAAPTVRYLVNIENKEEAENIINHYPEEIKNLTSSIISDMKGPVKKRTN